ncbi:hypothetical protein M0813_13792 [Anaeramoeba flamelloides]|uniref:AttH domain-containing protein n=1 Tax=Anaeramoeba flamelloides TaxID=1746091 RepID=A0AAV7YKE9_9EUKA|nr:hypothetical protein M0812_24510 [Anaeramoeba flamelloides]KAJ6252813.1 hypothetical protein M0813_13792 [Anaeramoeba flamelloides]
MDKKILIALVFSFFLFQPTLAGFFRDDGIVNPPQFWQRFRNKDYLSTRPFYQWWYYSLEDYEKETTYIFAYSYSRCVNDMTNQGSYVFFGEVNRNSQDPHWQLISKYPLDEFKVNNDFNVSIANGKFKLEPISDSVIHLKGEIDDSSHVWFAQNIDKSTKITWDLTLERVQGWYGQSDLELEDDLVGEISWNTYAHDSQISGEIKINSKTIKIEKSPNFRIYGDMNWGDYFPHGNGKEMSWGWYNVIIPAENPEDDIAIIVGSGKTKTGTSLGIMTASFSNIKIGSERQGFRYVVGLDDTPGRSVLLATAGKNYKLYNFNVTRTNWIDITDDLGTSQIPLTQVVHIDSSKWVITLTCKSTPEMYNRLLFPTDGMVFSDWEALGVNVHVLIKEASGKVILDKVVNYGGLEFGYKSPIHF